MFVTLYWTTDGYRDSCCENHTIRYTIHNINDVLQSEVKIVEIAHYRIINADIVEQIIGWECDDLKKDKL